MREKFCMFIQNAIENIEEYASVTLPRKRCFRCMAKNDKLHGLFQNVLTRT